MDKNGKDLMKTSDSGCSKGVKQIVTLEEGERIIGFRSGRRGQGGAYHYDFQLMIGRQE